VTADEGLVVAADVVVDGDDALAVVIVRAGLVLGGEILGLAFEIHGVGLTRAELGEALAELGRSLTEAD
jgi:hypothetical protein